MYAVGKGTKLANLSIEYVDLNGSPVVLSARMH